MVNSISHYIQRSRELGPLGTLRRVWVRPLNELNLSCQSLWWGWKAHRAMSDSELLAHTTGEWPTVDALFDHLAGRPGSSFLLPHESSQETAALLYRHYPEYVSALLAAADAICRNELSLLGHNFHFPNRIDWHTEPVTGRRFPLLHRSRLGQYLGSTRQSDLILFWELNRHQHLITLGIAYWLTGDQRYADAFGSQIQSWIETNPLQHGVNWYYGLEVSIRIIAWTAAFQFFRNAPTFREKTGRAFLKSLWQQADFLSNHLQTTRTDVPNNHMMAELTGLALIGAAFPEFREALAWRETGLMLLNQQATVQTYPDGVNKEQAAGYHRFVAELLLLITARSRQGALPHVPILEQMLERMLDYVLFTLTPVGTSPMWGDSDYGRALGLGQNKDFWDFRSILSAGAVLFDRADWKFAANRFDEEPFWVLGPDGLHLWQEIDARPPGQTSQAFSDAGLYVIRDAWTANTDVAFFRCGPFGLGGEGHCAHAHCDLLSLVLWVGGKPLLVDSGTYTYHGPLRDYFRLTAAHNTVVIDGHDQAIPLPNFNWSQISSARCIDWTGKCVTGTLFCQGEVEVTRELAHPQPGIWSLVDTIAGHAEHSIEWFFHFAPGLDLQFVEQEHAITVCNEGQPFLNVRLPDNRIRTRLRDTWFSYQYGVKQLNRGVYAIWQGELPEEGVSFHWEFQLVKDELLSRTV